MDRSYNKMYEAYHRIFKRCGLDFRAVEADAGAIGGEGATHEFMALTDVGEDTIAACTDCEYAANLEKAHAGNLSQCIKQKPASKFEKIYTPGIRTIDQLAQYTQMDPQHTLWNLFQLADSSIEKIGKLPRPGDIEPLIVTDKEEWLKELDIVPSFKTDEPVGD